MTSRITNRFSGPATPAAERCVSGQKQGRMDTFASLIEAAKKIDWAISVLAAIPLSILANLLTPSAANWWARRSVTKLEKRREKLQAELVRVETLFSNPNLLAAEGQEVLFGTLMWLALGLALTAFPIIDFFTGPIAAVCFLSSYLRASMHLRVLQRCKNFSEFKAVITMQLESLRDENAR